MKLTIYITLLIGLFSACSKEISLEEFNNYPVKFQKEKISYPTGEFSILIPKNWNWQIEDYENNQIELGINAVSPKDNDGFIQVLSIQKVKGLSRTESLETEYKSILNSLEEKKEFKIVNSGKTDILKDESYYIHFKSDSGNYGEVEAITFIKKANTKNTFYQLTASASQTKDIKQNMAVMITSIKTFEEKL